MGGIRPSPSLPFIGSHPEHPDSNRRVTSGDEPSPPRPRSWVPHPSRSLRWVGYDQPHLFRSSAVILSTLTRTGELRPAMNRRRLAQDAGCPIYRVLCDGWDSTKPISSVHRERSAFQRAVGPAFWVISGSATIQKLPDRAAFPGTDLRRVNGTLGVSPNVPSLMTR